VAENQIARISYSHEAFINWLLENPERPLRDAAQYFGYTQAWLSTILHSDVFQAKLSERQDAVFAAVAQDIPAKLRAAADIGLEKLTAKLEDTEDGEFILDATDKLLHRMGYAPSASRNPVAPAHVTNNTQINMFQVDAAQLAEARQRIGTKTPAAIEGEVLVVETAVRGEILCVTPLPEGAQPA